MHEEKLEVNKLELQQNLFFICLYKNIKMTKKLNNYIN